MRLDLSSASGPLALSVLLFGAFTSPAFAYLDPGTGSMILQLLLGGVAGAAVAGRFYWHRLLVILRIRPPADKDDASGESAITSDRRAD